MAENSAWRLRLKSLAKNDKPFQRDIWKICARDPLWWIDAFIWTYNPRHPKHRNLPMVLWDFQRPTMLEIFKAIGNYDLLCDKSREMGMTWMVLIAFLHRWQFDDFASFLLVSSKEDLVDKKQDPDCLFWKLDHAIEHQPAWLTGPGRPGTKNRTKLHLYNPWTKSTIDGSSTTGNVGRGGRRTASFFDEFASVDEDQAVLAATADTTSCRIFGSTPKGSSNAFYEMAHSDHIKKIRLLWTLHPEKAKGLTYDEDGKPTSPWYRAECKRRKFAWQIAQELNCDYLASDHQFFDADIIKTVRATHVRPPLMKGRLLYDEKTCEPIRFVEDPDGPMALWERPGLQGTMPQNRQYCLGIDIAMGSKASNSVISVGETKTHTKIAEFVSCETLPSDLAKLAVALCRWLKYAKGEKGVCPGYMIWENQGPGTIFTTSVMRSGFRNFYCKENDTTLKTRVTDQPGWTTNKDSKMRLLSDYQDALANNDLINPSAEAVNEMERYVFSPDSQQVWHKKALSMAKVDPSGAKENHGDRVIADALLAKAMGAADTQSVTEKVVYKGSLAWRNKKAREKARENQYW